MARKRDIIESVLIADIADGGRALARVGEMVVFVEGAVPGDVADLLVTKKRSRFYEARAIRIHSSTESRVEARCAHFGVCGGCKWQHLSYADQLRFKEKQVRDAMQRIAKVPVGHFEPILGSEEVFEYRNRLDFSFSDKRWLTQEEVGSGTDFGHRPALGFHVPGRWDKVMDVEHCHLQPEPCNAIRNRIKELALLHGITFFDPIGQQGFLRNLTLRCTTDGDWMLLLSVHTDDPQAIEALLGPVSAEFAELKSVLYVVNPKRNDTIHDLDIQVFKGEAFITQRMEALSFRIGPKSFFQTNGHQALSLYRIAREYAGLRGSETVYDLYTGTGTIALFVAAGASRVVGIEQVEAAIADARLNAELNGISNAKFFAGDMKDLLTEDFIAQHGRPDVVITDPPRAGMHPDVTERLLGSGASRIVYVSCNPATQARDIALLSGRYDVVRMRPVDMFPHTHHVECVALLQLRD